jgi:predicted chitinase
MHDPNIVIGGANYVAKYYPWSSAGQWWTDNKMNKYVDKGASVTEISKRVNCGNIKCGVTEKMHLPDRINNFNTAHQIFK